MEYSFYANMAYLNIYTWGSFRNIIGGGGF